MSKWLKIDISDIDTLRDSLWGPGSTYQNAFCTVWWSDVRCVRTLCSSWASCYYYY